MKRSILLKALHLVRAVLLLTLRHLLLRQAGLDVGVEPLAELLQAHSVRVHLKLPRHGGGGKGGGGIRGIGGGGI